jgi:ATP-dependent Clp protease protease subunit
MEGVATDIEIYAKQLEKTRDRLNTIISSQTGQSIDVVKADTDRDHWLDADEAVAYGLVSKVVENRGEI